MLIGNGNVNNDEFSYLSSLTGNIQFQLNQKQNLLTSQNKLDCIFIGNGDVSNAQLSFLSNIQSDLSFLLSEKQEKILNYDDGIITNLYNSNINLFRND